jgi:eukaryotic-like serine/threonine-protein kinase
VTAPGTRLGPYEVNAQIGAGGMGEVFRARDTRLGRDVAIKVLPAAFASDPERLARFEREAKLLASLNHANIAQVYGFESATLPDGSTGHFLAMELVLGEDLAERLKRDAIPVDEAIAVARQIAEALEEAHEKGIVHRDLKPANVKVTPDGKVKVLDFGLAKAYAGEAAASSPELSQSPTLAHAGTQAGVILGTAAYMSPEQARGKPVDKRADIWSFGVVLYEMLTGKGLFSGETVSDVLAAVLTRTPDWQALPPATPAGLARLLRRCLERDARRRLHDIADARLDLEDSLQAPSDEGSIRAGRASRSHTSVRWLAAALAVALLGALAGGIAVHRLSVPKAERVVHLALTLPTGDDMIQQASGIAISPDGTKVVFRSTNDRRRGLFVRSLDEPEPKFIPGSEEGVGPFFSPDGQSVAFFSTPGGTRRTGLNRIRIEGGTPIQVADVGTSSLAGFTFTGAWSESGQMLLSGPSPPIHRVSAAGGAPVAVTALDPSRAELSHVQPHLLPGGNGLLYVAVLTGGRQEIRVARGDGTPGRVLVEGATSPRFAPTGHLLYVREKTLFAARFDPRKRELTGEPVSVVEGLKVAAYGNFRQAQYDLSANGTLAYLVENGSSRDGRLVVVDRQGRVTPAFDPVGAYLVPRLSPDSERVAYAASNPKTGQREIWIGDLRRGTRSRLILGKGSATDPIWNPDGRAVTYAAIGEDGLMHVYSAPIDGSREPVRLIQAPDRNRATFPRLWLRDGSGLVVHGIGTSDDLVLWRPGSAVQEPLLAGPYSELEPSLSPDGRFLAYVSDESGQREVYIRPLEGTSRGVQVSSEGGDEPVWSPRGGELFYRRGPQMLAVPVSTARDITLGSPAILFEGRFDTDPFNNDATNYDVTNDGQRFIMVRRTTDPDSSLQRLNVVFNWFEELKARVPLR